MSIKLHFDVKMTNACNQLTNSFFFIIYQLYYTLYNIYNIINIFKMKFIIKIT